MDAAPSGSSRHPSDQQHRRYHKLYHGRVWPADACIRSTISIAGHEIVVRRAEKGEKFVTLDDQERTLDENVLVICDGEKSVGIAGIMGGENSMITDDVKTMLFEAACFDGTNIRLSSKRIGLRTDASAKFEKGLDPNNAEEAINRACQLIEELGAGEVVGGMADVYPVVKQPVRGFRLNRIASTHCSAQIFLPTRCLLISKRSISDTTRQTNEVIAPTFRQDLFRTADLAEEVARFYGYANIPTTLPSGEATTGKLPFDLRVRAAAQRHRRVLRFLSGYDVFL